MSEQNQSLKRELNLHDRSASVEGHWFTSQAYNTDLIEAIQDKAKGDTEKDPTSIPSPFARFDLVKSAFRNLILRSDLKGTLNDERLASACFDVGEIFFNYDKFKSPRGPIRIITWDREQALQTLRSGSRSHQRLGNAIDLYLREDAGSYNFAGLRKLFILHYQSREGMGVIGGTSPATLFFTALGDLSFVNITFGNHRVFDRNNPVPLHERDIEYQVFWHGLKRFMPGFREMYPELSEYLSRSIELLHSRNYEYWQRIGANGQNLREEAWNADFPELEFDTNYTVEFASAGQGPAFKMRKAASGPELIQGLSHFLISPTEEIDEYGVKKQRYTSKPAPMVLSKDFFEPLPYTRVPWRDTIDVKHFVPEDWRTNQRQLPGQADYYPYLTTSDFLEPYLVRLVYPINAQRYFDGGVKNVQKSYLLPLKSDFFEFFSAQDLMRGGEVSIQMEERAGGSVRVTLQIPLGKWDTAQQKVIPTGRTMKLSRMYFDDPTKSPDELKNEGVIAEHQFGLTVFPFVRMKRVDTNFKPMYRVHLVDRDVSAQSYKNEYKLSFFDDRNQQIIVPENKIRPRSQKNIGVGAKSEIQVIDADFERITVEVAGHRGVILPKFEVREMKDTIFTFAVDFGTTNTHVEYVTSEDAQPQPFAIDNDIQIATLFDPGFPDRDSSFNGTRATAISELVPQEMMPEHLGEEYLCKFPQRTALIENRPNFSGENLFGFGDFNIGFLYEKSNIPKDEYTISTNLKWSDFSKNIKAQKRIEGFLQSLLLLIRNKVLLNGGNLDQTQLLWFYPLSMVENQRNYFEGLWNKLYAETITRERVPRKVPESIAPFYWYSRGGGSSQPITAYGQPTALIDIGGGTSDIVIFEENDPRMLTSVRFAANAVFGDGYSRDGAAARNGYVKKYDAEVRNHLAANFSKLSQAYQSIKEGNRSEDIIAFYFSLKNNRDLREKAAYDFNDRLANDADLKIVPVVFYTAHIYHLARLMKAQEKEMPRYIAFSGTGSKVLDILTPRNAALADLAMLIFEKVYGTPYHRDGLDIVRERNSPKEATCKGGLKMPYIDFTREDDGREEARMDRIKTVLLGTTEDRVVERGDTYQKIDREMLQSVAEEVRRFIDILFGLEFSFSGKFGLNEGKLDQYKTILERNLLQNVYNGWEMRRESLDNLNSPIEETLFFYPLLGALNQLAWEAAN
ncbi:MAG: cell division protein FtsA [Siphonobacter sp.]